MFLLYTNDIINVVHNQIFLYADDTSLLSVAEDPEIAAMDLNADLYALQCWADKWHMTFNPNKTVVLPIMQFCHLHDYPPYLNGTKLHTVNYHTYN